MNNKMKVVRPKLMDEVLVNPGIGFNTFQRFNGDEHNSGKTWTEGFPIVYQNFNGVLENKDHPMSSVAYFRIYWQYLEPEENVYRWDLIDEALEVAKSRNQTLMLRVAPHGLMGAKEDVPKWYRALVGDKKDWIVKNWMVNPEDPLYLKYFGGFIKKLGDRYDGNPLLESVDVALISSWGEGEGTDLLSENTVHVLIDAYLDSFSKTPLLMMLYDGDFCKYALSKRNVGYRADCLGDMRGTSEIEGDFKDFEDGGWNHMFDMYPRQIINSGLHEAWKTAPVSFEVCWVVKHWFEMGWNIDYIIGESLKWHISTFNSKSSAVPKEWKEKVDRWLKKMGYRLALRRFTMPETVTKADDFNFTCWIENLGVAPCYKPYAFAIRLLNSTTSYVFKTDAEIINWLPGDNVYDSSFTLPQSISSGIYEVQIGIIDPSTEKPSLKLAIEGICDDGWYYMSKLTIT